MDELAKNVILGAPNFIVAVVVIVWASRLIESMVKAQQALVDKLLETCSENAELVRQLKESFESNSRIPNS